MKKHFDLIVCDSCGNKSILANEQRATCSSCNTTYPMKGNVLIMDEKNKFEAQVHEVEANNHEVIEEYEKNTWETGKSISSFLKYHCATYTHLHPRWLSPYLNGSIVGDIGCGQIIYIRQFLPEQVKAYYGIDLGINSLCKADENIPKDITVNLIQHDIDKLPLPSGSMDIVISCEVLEHLNDPIGHLKELNRICKPGGYLSISTPCVSEYFYPYEILSVLGKFKQWRKKLSVHEHWEEGVRTWHPGLRPKILQNWLNQNNFSVIHHPIALWYFWTPIKLLIRVVLLLEKLGMPKVGNYFAGYVRFVEKMLEQEIPGFRWFGIRQFVLAKKIGPFE